jgi:hypothetical protein
MRMKEDIWMMLHKPKNTKEPQKTTKAGRKAWKRFRQPLEETNSANTWISDSCPLNSETIHF